MKPAVSIDELPPLDEQRATLQRRASSSAGGGGGPNWAAVGAGFVCPGAGQLLVGRKVAGLGFLAMFAVGCAICLIPLFGSLLATFTAVSQGAVEMPPIPLFWVLGGFGLAIITWVAAMIHAAMLPAAKTAQ